MKLLILFLLISLIYLSYQKRFDNGITIVINNNNGQDECNSCNSCNSCNRCNSCSNNPPPPTTEIPPPSTTEIPPPSQEKQCECSCQNGKCVCKEDIVNGKQCSCSTTCKRNEESCNCSCQNGQCKCDKQVLSNGRRCTCQQKCGDNSKCNCICINGSCKCDKPVVNGKRCGCSTTCRRNEEKCNCSCQNGSCKCDKQVLSNGQRCGCSTTCKRNEEEKCNCSCQNGSCKCDKQVLSNGQRCGCSTTCQRKEEEKCNCSCQNGSCKCDKQVLSDGTRCFCSQSCSNCVNRYYPNFGQCDEPWGRLKYNAKNTFCNLGCLVVAVANYFNGYGIKINGETADPGKLHKYILENGGYINDFTFPFRLMERFGLKYLGIEYNFEKAKQQVCKGYLVALLIKKNPKTKNRWHFVLATGINSDGTVSVRDKWANGDRPFYTRISASEVQESYVYQPPN